MKDPAKQMLRLRSMYAEQESDCLLFQQTDEKDGGGLQLVETPFVLQHTEKVCVCLRPSCDSCTHLYFVYGMMELIFVFLVGYSRRNG